MPTAASRKPPRTLPRAAAVVGALLSALAVIYATSLIAALVGAGVFFGFYFQLGPERSAIGKAPAPKGPFRAPSADDQHRAA